MRIVGLVVKCRFDVRRWRLEWPTRFGACLSVGPIHIWIEPAYEPAYDELKRMFQRMEHTAKIGADHE